MPTPSSAPVRRTSLSMRVQRSLHLLQHQGHEHVHEQAWALACAGMSMGGMGREYMPVTPKAMQLKLATPHAVTSKVKPAMPTCQLTGKPSCTPAVRHLLPIHAPPLRSQSLVPPPPVRRRHCTLLRTCGQSGAGCGRGASNTNVDATQMGSNKNPCLLQPGLPFLCS